jgi:hypothetical protein
MADITMCRGKDCPIKEKCYKFTAPKGVWQSYYTETPGKMEDGKFVCNKYWDNSEENGRDNNEIQ